MDAINFAVETGRRMQRKQTGFVHYCNQSEDLTTHDTIPVLENALFALSLFRTRLADNVLEGKAIIEKLLAFEVGGNFPTYLHTYPQVTDPYLNLRLLPIFFWIGVDFGHVIGGLKQTLEACIERILDKAKKGSPNAQWAKFRLAAFDGKIGELPRTLSEWGEGLISLQLAEKRGANIEEPIRAAFKLWHPELHLYIGPASRRNQEGHQPELTLFDLYMCQWHKSFSERAAKLAPIHLQGALIRPLGFEVEKECLSVPFVHFKAEDECPLFIAWQQHTFVLARQQLEVDGSAEEMVIQLKEGEEANFFFNHHPDHQIFVDGLKATTFRQNETVEIRSKGLTISLQLLAEDGTYMGHILRGNRPSQHWCKGENQFAAFDWQISIRTIVPGERPLVLRVNF